MFITLQFPLFDNRYFLTDVNRTSKPEWPTPQPRDRVRYFGQVLDRHQQYLGPWDDEKKYCNAHSVINLCGTQSIHFFKNLHEAPFQSRILFRRFQSDGKCLSKFEIGFNDEFEHIPDDASLQSQGLKDLVFSHIQKYLLCPVKIRIGNKLSEFVPLIDAGKYLRCACYWATTKGKKSFLPKDMQNKMEHCEPVILIQLDSSRINFKDEELESIEMPELSKEKIKLYYHLIPYKTGRYNFNLKGWILCLPKNIYTNPVYKNEFAFYNTTVRYLRINLLRIHIETVVQKKFLTVLANQQIGQPATDQQVLIRIYTYLHKVLVNLSNIMRNRQPQEMLVQAVFRLDETYSGSDSPEEIIEGVKYYMAWLKTLNLTPETKQVISYLDKLIIDLENKKTDENEEKTVFISYNHKDEAAVQLLKNKLEVSKIKVILDTSTMKAGTDIEEFIGESIRAAQATISVVSNNSLLSGWVAIETVNVLNFGKLFKDKKYIACCLDEDFTKDNFIPDATQKIDERLKEIARLIAERNVNNQDSRDLNDEKSRLSFLRSNLDGIISKLKATLYVNIEGGLLEKNIQKIVTSV